MAQFIPAAGPSNPEFASLQDGLAIVATGDTHAAITSGQYVYVKNHSTLLDGLYVATANIAANASLTTSNLTADSNGGLNALSEHIAQMVKSSGLVSVTTNNNGAALIPTSTLDPSKHLILSATCNSGWLVSYSVYNGQYKVKLWDTSGATMQVDASATENLYFDYLDKTVL